VVRVGNTDKAKKRCMRRIRFTPCDIHSGRLITKVGGLEVDATKEHNPSPALDSVPTLGYMMLRISTVNER
jgi:hypothetical protein